MIINSQYNRNRIDIYPCGVYIKCDIINTKEGIEMIKTTLKIDGMMCGMCEAHMNDVISR